MEDEREIRPAIHFFGEDEDPAISPIYLMDELQNTPDRYIIVKTTENGKYLVNKTLHYKFRGVEIITDSDNAIFVDRKNNTVSVREYSRALREINPEDPEKRQYVMLLVNPYEDYTEWQSVTGRTSTYEWIKLNIENFDPKKSLILTENVCLKDAFTISQFCNHLKAADIIEDDGFNIADYEFEDND